MQIHTKDTYSRLLKKPQCCQNAHLIPTCPNITRAQSFLNHILYDKTIQNQCAVHFANVKQP